MTRRSTLTSLLLAMVLTTSLAGCATLEQYLPETTSAPAKPAVAPEEMAGDYYTVLGEALISDDKSDENAQQVGRRIAKILQTSTWGKAEPDVALVADELKDLENLDHLNTVLDKLYDLADAGRVWIM